jgi:hypothetical protein
VTSLSIRRLGATLLSPASASHKKTLKGKEALASNGQSETIQSLANLVLEDSDGRAESSPLLTSISKTGPSAE